jgi:Zn-dependent peptidase ImmA (M78 family)
MAADSFRKATGLNRGQSGLGEVLRSFVRASGILLIESPLPKSDVEGSAFNVGLDEQIPSLFANTYKSTWFRRNLVLSHELGHAVFDLQNDPFHADFRDVPCSEMEEIRANAFARELMIPRSVLIHLANSFGLNWAALSEVDLARLVAEAHVELREVLGAAREYGLIDEEFEQRYSAASIAQPLRELCPHSLTTDEYLRTLDSKDPVWAAKNRTVWIGGNRLRLPAGYVGRVLKAVESGKVTEGKAAELLLMDRYTFRDRFSSQFLLPEL